MFLLGKTIDLGASLPEELSQPPYPINFRMSKEKPFRFHSSKRNTSKANPYVLTEFFGCHEPGSDGIVFRI